MWLDYFVAFPLFFFTLRFIQILLSSSQERFDLVMNKLLKVRTVCWVEKNTKMCFFPVCTQWVCLFYFVLHEFTDRWNFLRVWQTVRFTCTSGKCHSQTQYGKGSPLQKNKFERWSDEHSITFSAGRPDQQIKCCPDTSPKKPFAPFFALLSMTKCRSALIKLLLCLANRLWVCFHKPLVSCTSTEKFINTAVIEINFPWFASKFVHLLASQRMETAS